MAQKLPHSTENASFYHLDSCVLISLKNLVILFYLNDFSWRVLCQNQKHDLAGAMMLIKSKFELMFVINEKALIFNTQQMTF